MGRKRNLSPTIRRHPRNGGYRCWANNRWFSLGPDGTSEDEIQRRYALLCQRLADNPSYGTVTGPTLTFGELVAHFLDSDESPRSQQHKDLCLQVADLLSEAFPERPSVEQFDADEFREFKSWVRDQKRDGAARWNITSQNMILGTVKRLMRFALSRRWADADAVARIKAVPGVRKGDAPPPRITLAPEPQAVADAITNLSPTLQAMVILLRETGMRPGEVCRLKSSNVHRQGKAIVQGVGVVDCEATGCWWLILTEHKTDSGGMAHGVPLNETAQAAIAPFLDREGYLFRPGESAKAYRTKADRFNSKTFRRAVVRELARAGLPNMSLYSIRHLVGMEADEAGGTEAVMAVLRHTRPQTSRRYAKMRLELAARLAKRRS